MRMMGKSGNKRGLGFTLAEAVMAMVVLSIAAAGVMVPFTTGAAVRIEGMRGTLSARLASDLMEKAVNTDFDKIVSQYNYTESQGQVKDVDGVVFTDRAYSKFSRKIVSSYVRMPQEGVGASSKYILVTVGVYYDGKTKAIINRLISK
jgi:hypothetical protein